MKRTAEFTPLSSKRTRWAIPLRPRSQQPQAGPSLPSVLNPQSHPGTDSLSETPPDPTSPDGIGVKVLHDCPDATVDICFVHGLTGNRDSTWTAKGHSTPWPKTLLPSRLKKARILTYGYDAYVVRRSVASVNRLIDHATNLMNDLTADRALCNASHRPLIFVAHCLGGLVCKEAILSSRNNPEPHLRGIFHFTKGIIFMGTPHEGSWMADWAKIPVSALGLVKSTNKSLLDILQAKNEFLESIRKNFFNMVRELREGGRRFEVTCFCEERPLLGMVGVVVPKESAVFDGFNYMTIPANHSDIAKFGSADEAGFMRLLGVLRGWKSQVGKREHMASVGKNLSQSLFEGQNPDEPDRISLEDRRKDILASLYFEEIDARQGIKKAQAETCKWLLQTPEYVDWRDPEKFGQHHGILYIDGNPGAGKSTIMKFAFNLAKETANHAAVVSFFFHARGNDLEKSPIGMYRSLLHQLLTELPDLQKFLDSPDFGLRSQRTSHMWDMETLRRAFSNVITNLGQRRLSFFIDALDECDQNEIQGLIDHFEELGKVAIEAGSKLYMCFSSRHYPYVRVQHCRRLTLRDQTGHAKAMEKYVRNNLKVEAATYIEAITAKILRKAGGIFLWVTLVVRILKDEFNNGRIFAVPERLDEIPDGISDLFKDILTRNKEHMADLLICIQWILYAKRPLKREEFYYSAAAVLSRDKKLEWNPKATRHDMDRFVLSSSKGLAEVTRVTRSGGGKVQFIHESVRDYLIKEGGLHSLWPELAKDFESLGHDQLRKCCQAYMQADISSYTPPSGEALPKVNTPAAKALQKRISEEFPFLSYAVDHVLYHANAAASGVSQEDFLEKFSLETWISLNNIYSGRPGTCRYQAPINLLYILAERNLTTLIRILRRQNPRISISGGPYKYPLFVALKHGHRDAIKALLEEETNPPQGDDILSQLYGTDFTPPKDGKPPISWALDMGYLALATAWITSTELDIDSEDQFGRTPLSIAAEKGHEAIVKLLLDRGKHDVDSKDHDGRTPLYWAAKNGHDAVVKLLLETSQASVDLKEHINGWQSAHRTPLSFAAENGHEAVVKLLLGTSNVKVDETDKSLERKRTPLSFAAERGHEAVVQLLLNMGKAEVNSKDKTGRTPLSWAAEKGRESVIELLLLDIHKANVNSEDNNGWTPLSWAARSGQESVVKLLLKTVNVNVDPTPKLSVQTPLSLAAERGHVGVVKLLLETGKVDVNSLTRGMTAGGCRTPLSLAAEKGHEAVVRLLLKEDNIDIDLKDYDGRTPLLWAAKCKKESVVKLLLETEKVNVNLKDYGGRTPLSQAAEAGHEAVVKLLLETGKADVNLSTGERLIGGRRTPLSFAAAQGHEAVVKLLLKADNIDIDFKDNDGQTPLLWAIEKGHENIIKLLDSAK